MSYEYTRVKLGPGVNLVCGPNGSGKSSILLGISVALGQSYTERARRLSDLIRWGSDIARITVVFDNRVRDGGKPFPSVKASTVTVSRILRRDGTYSFYVSGSEASKAEVVELLRSVGLDPDNPFIIMHQGTIESFIATKPEEKLKLLEKAVGFESYRRDIVEAKERLTRVLSEERSVRERLTNAQTTLEYWRREYERLLQYRRLRERIRILKSELLWARVAELEARIGRLKSRIEAYDSRIAKLNGRLEEVEAEASKVEAGFERLRFEEARVFERIVGLEKNLGLAEEASRILGDPGSSLSSKLRGRLNGLAVQLGSIRSALEDAYKEYSRIRSEEDVFFKRYVELRVEEALTSSEIARLSEERRRSEAKLEELGSRLKTALSEAEKSGCRPEAVRGLAEVEDELRLAEARLRGLGEVSDEAVSMYEKYRGVYEDLRFKLEALAENRDRLLEEIRSRSKVWRDALYRLLDEVNRTFGRILEGFGYTGYAKLTNPYDIEKAGLDIYMGSSGFDPVPLNNLTQSGGERSLAISVFLIALQQHVKSPFRALDEYDVHMDPRNREQVLRHILEYLSGNPEVQYMIITPNPLPLATRNMRVIIVHKVGGKSRVGGVGSYAETKI